VISNVAREQGMMSLRDDGMYKVLGGVTTLEEILRVVV
jgi:type II secretory ATPase GspE/PulE/Tfp pilus assembly ATPase PilB-like protein